LLGLVVVRHSLKMHIGLVIFLLFQIHQNSGVTAISEYNEYQYDEPSDEFDDVESEEELMTNDGYRLETEPLHIQARTGDRISLPCSADVKLESVEIIWERPDIKQIVSIGEKLIRDDNLKTFSIEAMEKGNALIIEAATKEHEGQYKCKLATKNSVEVTHSLQISLSKPKHQPLESGGSCVISTILPVILLCRLFL